MQDVRPPAELVLLPPRPSVKQVAAVVADAFREVYRMFAELQVGAWVLEYGCTACLAVPWREGTASCMYAR